MSSLYTIDSGNSHSKVAYFKDGILRNFTDIEDCDPSFPTIVSSVGPHQFKESVLFANKLRENDQFLGMPIKYDQGLGIDRICVAWYGFESLLEDEVALTIDTGSFTTIDLVSKEGLLGGYIFPGTKLYMNAYSEGHLLFSPKLDELKAESDLGHDTFSAINNSYFLFLDGVLKNLIEKHEVNKIILTGGSGELFFKFLENFNNVIVEYKKDLIHYALKDIYQRYKEQLQ